MTAKLVTAMDDEGATSLADASTLLVQQYLQAPRRTALQQERTRRLRLAFAALTVLRYRNRCRSRFYVKKAAVTGVASSAWRTLYHSRDEATFISVMGVSPTMFDELLVEVRRGVRCDAAAVSGARSTLNKWSVTCPLFRRSSPWSTARR